MKRWTKIAQLLRCVALVWKTPMCCNGLHWHIFTERFSCCYLMGFSVLYSNVSQWSEKTPCLSQWSVLAYFEKSALVHCTNLVNFGSFSGKNVNFAESFHLRLTKWGLCHVKNSNVSQWYVLAYLELWLFSAVLKCVAMVWKTPTCHNGLRLHILKRVLLAQFMSTWETFQAKI